MVGFNGDRFNSSETHVAVTCANEQRTWHGAMRTPVRISAISCATKSPVNVARMACECEIVVALAVAGLENQARNARKRNLTVSG